MSARPEGTIEQVDHDNLRIAQELADDLDDFCVGKPTAAVVYAIGILLARAAARSERPNLPASIDLLGRIATAEFQHPSKP